MERAELDDILAKHRKWRLGEDGGERANLSGADLSDAYLSRAYLSGAYLSGANLSRAYLSGADLSHNRYVIGCSLTNYSMVAFMHEGELKITCGCRLCLTIAQARAHWAPENSGKWEEDWGEQRLRMIDFLESEAVSLGWIKAADEKAA